MRIEIENLHKSFGPLAVFDGVNLSIEPGEIAVIMGRSGQGKSVMLKHLVGLEKPDSGRILIDGRDITGLSEKELYPVRMRFGMIFQNGGMLQSLNVEENVALPLVEVKGCDRDAIMHKVHEKLAMVGLAGKEKQSVTTLSGGQQKRVAIARALVQDADCLLFDEPTAGLDPPMSQTVDEVIMEMNEQTRATMIVVTHDLVSAFQIAHRMYVLDKGRIVASGTPDEIRGNDNPVVREFLKRGTQI